MTLEFLSAYVNRNRSALVRELLSNNSPFVGQLYAELGLSHRWPERVFRVGRLSFYSISVTLLVLA